MDLALHITIHFVLSLIAGFVVWNFYKRASISVLAALAGGVLVDIDHLIDYFLAFGFDFKMDYFLSGYQFLRSGKIYILFHGWEYVVVLIVLASVVKNKFYKSVFLAVALGLFFHLSADSIINNIPAKSYWLTYRAENNFVLEKLVEPRYLNLK